jgi:hypothetical protein
MSRLLYIRTEPDTGYNFFLQGNIPAIVSLRVIIKHLLSELSPLADNDAGRGTNWGRAWYGFFYRAPGMARVSCRDSLPLSRCDRVKEYSVSFQTCAHTKQPQGAFGAIAGQLSGVLHGIGQSHGTGR